MARTSTRVSRKTTAPPSSSRVSASLATRARSLVEEGSGAGHPDDLLLTEEIAIWFRVTSEWIEVGRFRKYGPPYAKIRGIVRYRRGDVIDWLSSLMTRPGIAPPADPPRKKRAALA